MKTKKGLNIIHCDDCKSPQPHRKKMSGMVCNKCNTVNREDYEH